MGARADTAAAGERAAWRWLAGYVRPSAARLAGVMALSLAAAALGLAQPWLTMVLVDDGLLAGRHDIVLWTAGAMIALALGSTAIGYATRMAYTATSARILHGMREDLFAHLMRLSPAFFARARQGDVLTRVDGDIAEVQRFAVDSVLGATNSAVLLAGAVIVLYQLSPALTAVMVVFLVVNAAILRAMRPRMERLTRRARERGSDLAAFFVERLGAAKSVQAFNGQRRELERLGELHQAMREDTLRLQGVGYLAGSIPALVLAIGTAGVFVVGSQQMSGAGTVTLGTLIAFATYLQRATGPLHTLLGLYVALQRARVSLMRVRELAVEPAGVELAREPVPLPAGGGAIEIEGVTFAYPGAAGPVLREARASIPAGSRVLLAGRSGAGKTTLIDLLHRHFDPDAGVIRLDGADLRALDPAELRRAVAVVAQDVVLFSASIAENIRYGAPHASGAAVAEAARAARVAEFAAAMPQGLETTVGQRGLALSGGQRQRISIARALLMAPRVLVLDEGTSAVDVETEADIRGEIDRLFAGRTRVVVSHRPLDEREFDLVLEIEGAALAARAPLRNGPWRPQLRSV